MLRRIYNFIMRIFLQRRSVTVEPFVPSEQSPIEVIVVDSSSTEEPIVYVAHVGHNESITQRKSPQTILEFATNNRIAAMKRASRRLVSETTYCGDPC
jgi:hypothetical protein